MTPLTPFEEAIRGRRSPRRFDPDRPVSDDQLRRVLSLAGRAPSPGNLQPWRFVVVRSPAGRRLLRRASFGDRRLTEAPVGIIVLGYHRPQRTLGPEIAAGIASAFDLTRAEAARAAALADRVFEGHPDPSVPASRSAMLAVAWLMIAAEGVDLASSLADRFDPRQIRDDFGVPSDHTTAALIALGYPLGPTPDPGRLPLDELCYEEHFGQPWTLGEPEPTDGTTMEDGDAHRGR